MRFVNTIAVSGDSARRMHEAEKKELRLRLFSALVLAPVAFAAIYFGTPYLEAVLTVAGVAMAWEWDRLCGDGRFDASGVTTSIVIVVVGVAAGLRRFDLALLAVLAGIVVSTAVSVAQKRGQPVWLGAGSPVIGIPLIAIIWMRVDPEGGFATVIWLVGAVWATDIGGFVVGRLVGGPKLAPAISPGKTWAGLVGAGLAAALWGLLWGYWANAESLGLTTILGGFVAMVAQAGDLGVSFVKRRFGAKDASNLIPGHGGVLDRFDGLLSSAPTLAIVVYVSEESGFLWR